MGELGTILEASKCFCVVVSVRVDPCPLRTKILFLLLMGITQLVNMIPVITTPVA